MDDRFLTRGKCEKGLWVEGYLIEQDDPEYHAYICMSGFKAEVDNRHQDILECDLEEIIPETVGRCTGLTDKNNTQIYEGDFLKAGDFIFVVKFGKCGGVNNVDHEVGYMGFYVMPVGKDAESFINSGLRTDILYWLNACDVYVIGNIHDDKPTPPENFEIFPA